MRYLKILLLGMVVMGLMATGAMAAVTTRNMGASTTGITWGIPYEGLSTTTYQTTDQANTGMFFFTSPASAVLDVVVTFNNSLLVGTPTSFYKLGFLSAAITDATTITASGTVMANTTGGVANPIELPVVTAGTLGVVSGNKITFTSVTLVSGGRYMVVDATNNAVIVAADVVNSLGIKVALPPTTSSDVAVNGTFSVTVAINFGGGGANISTTTVTLGKYVMSQTYAVTKIAKIVGVAYSRLKFNDGTLTDTLVLTPTAASGTNPFMLALPNLTTHIASVIFKITGTNQTAISTVKESIGPTTLTYASGAWPFTFTTAGAFPVALTFTFTMTGTTIINTGSFTVEVTGTGKTGYPASFTYLASTSAGGWTIDGYQAIVPHLSTNSTVPTICIFNNTTTTSADVFVDVISTEGTITGLTNLSLGPIAALTTKRIDFSGTSIIVEGGSTTSIATMGDAKRYAGKFTVTVDQNSVYVNCLQTDPYTGSKRSLPVLTGGTITWKE